MQGKLSFSGDTRKAMSLMRFQKGMGNAYQAALDEVGELGDLTQIGQTLEDSPIPSKATGLAGAPPSAVVRVAADGQTAQKFLQILALFLQRLNVDEGMAASSKGKDVVMQFTIKDLNQLFYMCFVDGTVEAGMGAPSKEIDVNLKMDADIFDGMMTGRINANKAAMQGKMSFSGNTRKAMSLQRFMKGMNQLYQDARDEIGDPGDLTHVGVVESPPSAVVPSPSVGVQAAPVAPTAVPSVIKVGDIRDDILKITNEMYARGLITATGGNISARAEDNPEEIWITPSAIFKGDLRTNMMVRIDLEGNILGEQEYNASSERKVHCEIYKRRPDVTAVIHSHAKQATLMSFTDTPFLPISTEAAFIGDIPVVPFIMPGSPELAQQVADVIGDEGIAALMGNHGLVVAGTSLRRAADMTYVVEVTAENLLTCRMLGIKPTLLPEELVAELKEMGRMLA
jgi:autoinducer 2 (AI-2) kinase